MWGNERNIKLSQARFIGGLSKQRFCVNVADVAQTVGYLGWLAEPGTKRWPTGGELEMPDLPWSEVEEDIQKPREIGMLEWICHLRFTHLYLQSPETYLSPIV